MFRMSFFSIVVVAIITIASTTACHTTVDSSRDYSYEAYCDSIWEADPDYYMDVVVESDEYSDYIEKHGKWWED